MIDKIYWKKNVLDDGGRERGEKNSVSKVCRSRRSRRVYLHSLESHAIPILSAELLSLLKDTGLQGYT